MAREEEISQNGERKGSRGIREYGKRERERHVLRKVTQVSITAEVSQQGN